MIADAASSSPSADHARALVEGQRLAAFTGRAPGSADVLLGLLRAGGAAARLLAERSVTAARLEPLLHLVRPEPQFDLAGLERASHEIRAELGARQTTSLHLFLALLRTGGSAVDLLRRAEQDPARLRALVLRALTGPTRLAERATPRPVEAGSGAPAAPRPRAMVPDRSREPAAGPAPQADGLVDPPGPPTARAARPRPHVEITAPTSVAPPAAEAAPAPAPGAEPPSGDLVFVEPPVVPTLHRERETSRLLDLLQTQTARIACVVGDPGAGRTALLASLATALPDAPVTPVSVPPAGPGLGAWIEAIHKRAPREVPIVLDGCPGLGQEGADGASQLLAAARAGRRWILAATPQDVRRIEGVAPELAVNLEKVSLSPLSPEALVEVLDAGLGRIAEVAGVDFAPDVCRALVRLASRYPSESALPGRALTIAELAAARVGRRGGRLVGEEDVAHVVAEAAELPPERLLRTDDERFRTLEQRLAERVVGHDDARARIADVLRRSYAGFRGQRPLASFLLLGPTGVGKTETARAIADALFDGESALVRIDLSEYNEPHSVARLVGSPPGYVGYEEGGQLTEALRRRPACVVLLDELEKAHKEVLLLLLQVLEDGRLTDGRGRTVDFSAAAIVMTSNLGSELYRQKRAPSVATIQALARSRLPPELWNRIDEVLCFGPLGEAQLARVVARFARESSRRLEQERGISYRVEEPVIQAVLAAEPDRSLGARPLRRAFERLVEGPLAAQILAGQIRKGARLVLARSSTGQLLIGADG